MGFVLLIACLNVANLLLACSVDRRCELALRAALGAGRMRVVQQLLTESMLLEVLGGAAGLLVAVWSSHALVVAFPGRIPVPRLDQSRMDTGVLLFNVALSMATGLAFGLVPAFYASRLNLSETLKDGGRGASSGVGFQRLRNLLVVAETALSVVLLAGAGLMLRSFDKLLGIHPGFNPESVLTLRVPLPVSIKEEPLQAAYYSRMLERVQRLPGLNAAGLITPLPLGGVDANATFGVEGRPAPAGERQLVKLRAVSTGYFRAMGVGLRRGRLFSEGDGAVTPAVVVINESLARRYFPTEDPLGRRVGLSGSPKGPWFTIVGVVNDVKYLNLRDEGSPEMYRDYRQYLFAPFAVTLALRTGVDDPMRLAATVQKEIRAANPDQPITDVKSMRQVISENVSQPRFYTLLLSIFAGVAVLLAAAGLYGVLAHAVSGRVREIGIRIALGASPRAIVGQVVGHALALVAAGIGIGLAASCALTRLLAAQLFQVSPTDPLTFAAVSAVLAAVAAAASFLPARRAAAVNPVTALRCQ